MSAPSVVTPSDDALTVMIMAGGTGGHVYPALSVAAWLRERRHRVVWLGTARGIEARLVPQAGYPLETLAVTGLRGKSLATWLAAPFKLMRSLGQALVTLRRHRPDVVLGMGGFVTGPGGLAAWLTRTPLLIHEQNAIAGLSNRLLSRLACRVFEAFPHSFPDAVRAVFIGNPVRSQIEDLPAPGLRFENRRGQARLLVLGGSQGAKALNEGVPAALATLPEQLRPSVLHQAGARGLELARNAYEKHEVVGEVVPFIDDMAGAYAQADLVICRAGALTIAELTAAGVGAVLVPYPHAVDDHQTHNGRALVDAGAALMVQETAMEPSRLGTTLGALLTDRVDLQRMAERSRALARPGVTAVLGEACLEAARTRRQGAAR
jgi:UDP-N-acetylglucosamine--N-acetylmuramyl-(pentapeptide) pyrophosphoryl-undecaprenol N-acetylglucosamine transferase